MNCIPLPEIPDPRIDRLISALESLRDGELAVDLLVACGERAITPLERFLLGGSARTIALPRCRAVRILGALGAYRTLLAYLEKRDLPRDPEVLFAEDAVRSAVGRELARWRSEEVFQMLLRAAKQRATAGLIDTIGDFRRPEAIPLLFYTLEDDLCRNAAYSALCKTPEDTRHYAILSLRGETETSLTGPAASRRRRATTELLRTFGISQEEWQDLRELLEDEDPSVVVCVAALGFCVAPPEESLKMVEALFRVANKLNWLQEEEVIQLLHDHKELAHCVAEQILANLRSRGQQANWLSPLWRILQRFDS
jgi:hypothetical protein